jgi:hypothetical protein
MLHFGRLRILVLVDHVLGKTLGHKAADFRLHPCRHERSQVLAGIAVQHQLVVDDLVGRRRGHLARREALGRDGRQHGTLGKERVDRQMLGRNAAAMARTQHPTDLLWRLTKVDGGTAAGSNSSVNGSGLTRSGAA